jgi:sterol 3beta-glucosyltransferase
MAASNPTSNPMSKPMSPLATAVRISEDENRHHHSKKLQKRRRDGAHSPHGMELPERLRAFTDGADDEEDVRAPPQGAGATMNMNTGIFSLLAAAGSNLDFHDRYPDDSSDDDHHQRMDGASSPRHTKSKDVPPQLPVSKKPSDKDETQRTGKHRRKLSGARLLQSLPSLTTRFSSKSKRHGATPRSSQIKEEGDADSSAAEDDPHVDDSRTGGRLAPVMSRMLEARAEVAARPSFDLDRLSGEKTGHPIAADASPGALSTKLMEIFHFDKPEEVIEEYSCFLVQSVLLQGYMYITAKHICFYAYLPQKAVRGSQRTLLAVIILNTRLMLLGRTRLLRPATYPNPGSATPDTIGITSGSRVLC